MKQGDKDDFSDITIIKLSTQFIYQENIARIWHFIYSRYFLQNIDSEISVKTKQGRRYGPYICCIFTAIAIQVNKKAAYTKCIKKNIELFKMGMHCGWFVKFLYLITITVCISRMWNHVIQSTNAKKTLFILYLNSGLDQ